MNDRVHAHIPYSRLSHYLERIIQRRVNPEIAFSAEALDSLIPDELASQARQLRDAGLAVTIHAPFLDLNPGALDRVIREATRQRFLQTFQAAKILKPRVIVFHPGYDDLRYGDKRAVWLKNSVDFWRGLIPLAQEIGCAIAVENIFEKEPSTLRSLFEAINEPCFGHCFDVGHWNMFTTVTMDDWFAELGALLLEAHVHDNHGQADEHLPLGEGEIDFDLLFGLIGHYAPDAVLTIEAHSSERLERALKNIGKYV
jgi:sugar phosphate isomerase/epimerase